MRVGPITAVSETLHLPKMRQTGEKQQVIQEALNHSRSELPASALMPVYGNPVRIGAG